MATQLPASDLKTSINDFLRSKSMPPTQAWLHSFMPSIRPNAPVAGLQKTALFRLLSTDLTASVQPSPTSILPAGISNPETKERRLPGPIPAQVLDIEDIGHSRWSQVENIEAQERGEMTKGREVIRVVDDESNSDPNHTPQTSDHATSGPHKLLLQDAKGSKIYAFELEPVTGVNVQMSIGAKLVLRDVVVARGMVLLEPKCVEVLGGKVEAWDRKWRGERKGVLKGKAGMGVATG